MKIRLIVLFMAAWGLLVLGLNNPYYGAQDAPRVWIPAAVRNFDLYGLDQTGLMIIRNTAPVTPDQFHIYSHHPPLMVWLPAALTIPLGYNELGMRYGFVALTMISVALIYVLVRRLYGERVAFWAAIFYTFPPMMIYYGRVAGYSQFAFVFGLLFAIILMDWLRQPTRIRLLMLAVVAWLAVWSAWPAVFYVAGLGFAGMFLGDRKQRMAIVGLGCVTIIAFVALMGFYQLQWDQSIDSLLDAFVWRSSDATFRRGSEPFDMPEFFWRFFLHAVSLITLGVIVLATVGVFALRRHGTRFANTIVIGLFLGGVGYQLAFRNASYIHDYYKIYLMPAVAVAAAMAWVYIRNNPSSHRILRPVLDAQLLAAVVQTVLLVFVLHRSVDQPWLDRVIKTIDRQAAEEDVIVANYNTYAEQLGYLMVTEFYTFRNIRWNVEPEAVLDARPADGQLHYFYCNVEPVTPPEPLSGYSYTVLDHRDDGDHCLYYVFDPVPEDQ
jgi:4-amino-4-deoxy-L-arabinose transferase-like glycosyltransferase